MKLKYFFQKKKQTSDPLHPEKTARGGVSAILFRQEGRNGFLIIYWLLLDDVGIADEGGDDYERVCLCVCVLVR